MNRKFTLNIDGIDHQIELEGNSLLVDGQPFVMGIENGTLTINGIVYQVELGEGTASVDGEDYAVEASGMSVRAAAPKKAVPRKKKAAAEGSVVAMMPGAILKVLVAEGDQVEEADVVVVLEAMKMENEIHAHRSGVVKQVYTSPGENVEKGQPLIEIV